MFINIWVLIVSLVILIGGIVYASALAYRHSQYSKKMFVRCVDLIDQRDKLAKILVQHQRKGSR